MNETSLQRCVYKGYDGVRCTAEATHMIQDAGRWSVKGMVLCETHAIEWQKLAYNKKSYVMKLNLLNPQAARIAALEAMLKRLQWWEDCYADYPLSYCPICHAREFRDRCHEDDCELAALLPKEKKDAKSLQVK